MLRRSFRRVIPALSILGLMALSFLLGAAVVRFKLPTAGFLDEAFTGAETLLTEEESVTDLGRRGPGLTAAVDDPTHTCDGFTLYTTNKGAEASLIDMRGEVVHRWTAPFSLAFPRPRHVRRRVDDDKIYLFGCHLYPNGDLLGVYHGTGDTPYGYGVVKLDRESRVKWAYPGNAHHAVDVGEDGVIYVLTQEVVREMPRGLGFLPAPALVDYLCLLSPEGKELRKVPLLEAFRDSPYALLLTGQRPASSKAWDLLHANSVEVLRQRLAPAHAPFRAGQVLLSLRELDALAVLDVELRAVVWAARGPWRRQHDPHFLENGRLLLFDNLGSPTESRVIEYDPRTQACPWTYPGEGGPSFRSVIQGRAQRLPNGNTLIVNSADGVLLELTPDRRLVWSCSCHAHVPFARRFAPDQLSFLKGARHARP
jgi:hypothetical protein